MEPFRILFPIGMFTGIWGVTLWILFGFGAVMGYPSEAHPDTMIACFLFAFVSGFLMTAVPRFTGSFSAKLWEVGVMAVLLLAACILSAIVLFYPDWRVAALSVITAQGLFLAVYCIRRFLKRHHNPPPSFLFVGLGLLFSLAGPLLLLTGELGWASENESLLGRALFYHGMILSLVMGVGSRLIPAFLGHAAQPVVQLILKSRPETKPKSELPAMIVLALLFCLTFPLEIFVNPIAGRALRAALVSYLAIVHWKVHRPPTTKGALTFWLRACAIFLVIGLWVYAFMPDYSKHAAHLIFITGFSLLVILIATRVTLSHGGYDMSLERRSRAIHWTGILLVVAALGRFFAPISGGTYTHHLAYSAVIWIAAILVWAFFSIPKMLPKRKMSPAGAK